MYNSSTLRDGTSELHIRILTHAQHQRLAHCVIVAVIAEDIGFPPGERLEEQVHQGLCWLHDGLLPDGRIQAQSQPGHIP